VSLIAREVFIKNYFMRVFVLVDTLTKIRQLILRHQSDPENVERISSHKIFGYSLESTSSFTAFTKSIVLLKCLRAVPLAKSSILLSFHFCFRVHLYSFVSTSSPSSSSFVSGSGFASLNFHRDHVPICSAQAGLGFIAHDCIPNRERDHYV
jgi:hypothetical protein